MVSCDSPKPPHKTVASSSPVAGPSACPIKKPVDPWIAAMLAILCPQEKAFLQNLKARGVQVTAYDKIWFDDPYYDGKTWTTKRFDAGGVTQGNDIQMIRSPDASENAATIFHEGVHTGQAPAEWRELEYDAYTKEDQWRISHGLPPHDPSFRKKDASGKEVTNLAGIRTFVDREYPGVTAKTAKGPPETIIGKTATGLTTLKRADGTTYDRKPKKGDSYPADKPGTDPPGGVKVDMDQLQCP